VHENSLDDLIRSGNSLDGLIPSENSLNDLIPSENSWDGLIPSGNSHVFNYRNKIVFRQRRVDSEESFTLSQLNA